MREDRLRRALLPTWPPESASEAMLLLVCAAAVHLLVGLWVLPDGGLVAQPGVGDAVLALLAALARPVALGLLLALAARAVLGARPSLALGLGALQLAGTWPAPLLEGLGGLAPEAAMWMTAVCVALLAFPAARLARAGLSAALLLAAVSALLITGVAFYPAAHAWLLDALGIAVRGALVFGLSHAGREALDSLPLLALCLIGWLTLGGSAPRRLVAAAWRGAGWPVLLACACCMAWGFVVHGAGLHAMPGILQPPAVYAPLALLGALGALLLLAQGWRARRLRVPDYPDAGQLGIVAAWALALGYLAGPGALLAAALAGGLLGAAMLFSAGGGLPCALRVAGGGICAVLLYAAGGLAVPGGTMPAVDLVLVAGLFVAGAAFAGLVGSGTSRLAAALWLVLLFAALALVAMGAGRGDMIALCGALLAVMLLFLLLPGRSPEGRLGDAALCCLGLLAAATAVLAALPA